MPFPELTEFFQSQAPLFQKLPHDSSRLFLHRLFQRLARMNRRFPFASMPHLAQALHKIISPKFPSPPDPLPEFLLCVSRLPTPRCHQLPKFPAPTSAVPPDPLLGVSPAYYRFSHELPTMPSTESEELPRSIDLSSKKRGGAFSLFGFMALGGFEVEWGFIAECRV